MKKIVSILIFLILLVAPVILRAQITNVYKLITKVDSLIAEQDFRAAYDTLQHYSDIYKSAGKADRKPLLVQRIKLSFTLDRRHETREWLNELYTLEPSLSSVKDDVASPALLEYIDVYEKSRSERYIFVNKRKQDIELSPSTVTVYTKEDIELLGPRDLLDLIRITPGFAELGDNNERQFGTRGSSNTTLQDVLFLINGHRITDILTNTNAPDWISLNYIEQVEIVRGPGSALYGGSALNGVVNIITKSGSREPLNTISLTTGTGNDFRDLSFRLNTYRLNYEYAKELENGEGFYFSGTYFQSGGSEISYDVNNPGIVLPDISGGSIVRPVPTTGTEYINRYAPGYNLLVNYYRRALKVTANAQSSNFIYSRPASLNLWQSFDKDSLRKQRRRIDKREFVHLEYDLLDQGGVRDNSLVLKLSGDHFSKDFYTTNNSFGIAGNTRLVGDEFRATTALEYSSDLLLDNPVLNQSYVLFGAEGIINNWFYNYFEEEADTTFVLRKLGDNFSDSVGDSRNEYIAAGYAQWEAHWLDGRFISTAGFRLNYHNEYATFNDITWGEEVTPRFAIIFKPTLKPCANDNSPQAEEKLEKIKFKFLYSSAFLPPPFLYRRGGVSQFRGSPDLKSQIIESGEIVVFGDLTKSFKYSFQTYANKVSNYISRPNDIYINQTNDRRVSGYELEINYKEDVNTGGYRGFANIALTKEKKFNDTARHSYFDVFNSSLHHADDSLILYPKYTANLGINRIVSAQKGKLSNLNVGLVFQLIGKTRVNSDYGSDANGVWGLLNQAELQHIPAAFLVHFNASVTLQKKLKLAVSAFNVLEKSYNLPSSVSRTERKRAEGRMIYLTLKYDLSKQ